MTRALIEALKEKNPVVRWSAAVVLGEIGPAAKVAIVRSAERLKDRDKHVRREAARALRKIDPEAAKRAGVL